MEVNYREVPESVTTDGNRQVNPVLAVPEEIQSEADKLREAALAFEVFDNDMLLEILLCHAIHKRDNNELDRLTISSIRRVNKTWMKTVSKLLLKSHQPLFNLVLNKKNSVSGSKYVREKGKVLDQFVNPVATSFATDPASIPTFHVRIMEQYFRRENLSSLANFLQKCGRGLLDLELFLPFNGGSLPCLFPLLSFPLLQKLTVNLTDEKLRNIDADEKIFKDSQNITYLLQTILNSSQKLSELVIPVIPTLDLIPANFQHLFLPQCIAKLTADCLATGQHMELLINNNLSNLKHLYLAIPEVTYDGENLFKVLESVRGSLETLHLTDVAYEGVPTQFTLLRLPVMEKLKDFTLTSIHCELDPRVSSSLERFLPSVTSLSLHNQTEDMFQKWTTNSRFASVTKLSVELVDDNFNDENNVQSINLENMQILHRAFSNVKILDLKLSARETCGLKYMFMEMTKLTSLKLDFANTVELFQNSDYFDALLTGTTLEFIAGLRQSRELWEKVDLKDENMPSLQMLKDLTTLTLETAQPSWESPINSDLLFYLAILKMPKLEDLTLKGKFGASKRVLEIWKSQSQNKQLFAPHGQQ